MIKNELFSITKKNEHIIYNIFGIKLKFKIFSKTLKYDYFPNIPEICAPYYLPYKNWYHGLKFIEFNKKNKNEIAKYFKELNKNLDKKSQKIAFDMWNRYINKLSVPENSFLKRYDLFSKEEIKQCDSIDNVVTKYSLEPKFIKLDIGGYELKAIKGALNTIKKYKPILMISVYHSPDDLFFIKPFIEKLNLDYKFRFENHNPFDPVYETILMTIPNM